MAVNLWTRLGQPDITPPLDRVIWFGAWGTDDQWYSWRVRYAKHYGVSAGTGHWQERGGARPKGLLPTHWAEIPGPPSPPERGAI